MFTVMVMLVIIHHWTYCKDNFFNVCSHKTCQIVAIRVGHSLHYEIPKMKIAVIDPESCEVILFRLHIKDTSLWKIRKVVYSFMTMKWQIFFSPNPMLFFFIFIFYFITTVHASLSPISAPEMSNVPSSLPICCLGDSAPLLTWKGEYYLPCDCAPPVSVTDLGVDIWLKLGWSNSLPGIWNRDKEAESFSYVEPSCKVMPSWPAIAGRNLMLATVKGSWETMSQQKKTRVQTKEHKDGADRHPESNREAMYLERQRRERE